MKKLPGLSAFFHTCSLFFVLPAVVHGQGNSTTGISGFSIPEQDNPRIGFTSFDIGYPLVSKKSLAIHGGMRFIGATTGIRGGYFAFGYFSELLLRPQERFQLGINTALVAGGGAAAPDKDGWLAQATLFSQYQWKNGLGIRAGLNYAYVSGGAIKGVSPLLGLSWKLRTTAAVADSGAFAWNAVYSELGVGTFGKERLGFIGAGAGWKYGRYLAGDAAIHALANTHGGYMQILLSGGPALSWRSFQLSPALVSGLGGGGSVKTVGGALYGAQLGLSYSGKRFHAGIKYQHVEAFSKQFRYDGLFVSIGKTLQQQHAPSVRWYLITKAYLGKDGFGNIGARFIGYEYKKLRLMGSTYWAFTHNRGAYAEGLFEATLNAPGDLPFYLVASGGAGAGGGINRKTASLIYAGGIGFASPWKKFPVQVEAACGAGGNIPSWSVSVAYRL